MQISVPALSRCSKELSENGTISCDRQHAEGTFALPEQRRAAAAPIPRPLAELSGRAGSLDHLVGTLQQRLGHGETERPGGLEVDDQLEFARLLKWQISGFGTLQDFTSVNAFQMIHRRQVRSVAEETASIDMTPPFIDRRNGMARCQRCELGRSSAEQRGADDDQRTSSQAAKGCEGGLNGSRRSTKRRSRSRGHRILPAMDRTADLRRGPQGHHAPKAAVAARYRRKGPAPSLKPYSRYSGRSAPRPRRTRPET